VRRNLGGSAEADLVGLPSRPTVRLTRLLLLTAVLLLVGLNLSGCSLVRSAANVASLPREVQFAAAFCSKQHAGTAGVDVPAGFAAKQLRADHIVPDPWSALPRTETIFWCFGKPPNLGGFFVDSSGLRTAAPITNQGGTCQRTGTSVTCSGRLSLITP
jgi:hypothetical protein